MATTEHPNIALLKRCDPGDLARAAELFAEDFVWHFFNPRLPDVQGDYVGVSGLQACFEKVGRKTGGTFRVKPISLTAAGHPVRPCGNPADGIVMRQSES